MSARATAKVIKWLNRVPKWAKRMNLDARTRKLISRHRLSESDFHRTMFETEERQKLTEWEKQQLFRTPEGVNKKEFRAKVVESLRRQDTTNLTKGRGFRGRKTSEETLRFRRFEKAVKEKFSWWK